MTKLMLTALMFCSSLCLAADPSTQAPKKKASKLEVIAPPTSEAQKDEAVFGGTGLGTAGVGTGTASSKKAKPMRGTAPAPTK